MAETGQCPSCARPFTAAEIAGYGILRSRSAREGGPIMEYPCQGCGRRIRLIPHGDGRYALPGQPPPPAVPAQERQPPWARPRRPRPEAPVQEAPPPEPTPPDPDPVEVEVEVEPPTPEPEVPAVPEDVPITITEALEVLGVGPEADARELEQAFHTRSKTCHPDKVAHLDAEFQQLAERKFKRLQAAYALLKR